jgi:hypothetical protein
MQLDRARLSPTERLRKLSTKSCLYCGTTGHYISTCPLKDQAHQVGTSTLVGRMRSFPSSISRTPLHAILLWGDQSKSLRVLIDSDESFMDAILVSELEIPLSIPMDVRVLDGCSIGCHPYYVSH